VWDVTDTVVTATAGMICTQRAKTSRPRPVTETTAKHAILGNRGGSTAAGNRPAARSVSRRRAAFCSAHRHPLL
jgi:hypothetical protein